MAMWPEILTDAKRILTIEREPRGRKVALRVNLSAPWTAGGYTSVTHAEAMVEKIEE
jgi:hypothetical protein